ncbi:MAG: hypothetical protein VX083_15060 [Pseudomonadota bacterium]|jgi:hypothetical protein|uniref:hypothetical protein n=1 Tax=Thalassovita sp. TaxID=1979401 RepID=UPI002AB1EBD6|nr:hypothetical protein [Thalassovita sp.]MEC8042740.1 hypothetical protein [Pseudomonadota bacterium]MEC8294809.1 hypothetical protein [Pseudomonadota bacterium]|tara:strand:- start:145 stop:471 length:327 start_codon:yes stop_codon:yes gene_type:complete
MSKQTAFNAQRRIRPAVLQLRGQLDGAGQAGSFRQVTEALSAAAQVLSHDASHFYAETEFGTIEAWRAERQMQILLRSPHHTRLDRMRQQVDQACAPLPTTQRPIWQA